MPSLLSTAVSGLVAHRTALSTTGHNISNVNTEGYSRQVADFETNTPFNTGGRGYIGTGTHIDGVRRIVDQFVDAQLRADIESFSSFDARFDKAGLLDGLLANPQTGITGAMNNFFSALQVAADDPTSIPARQVLLTEAGSLVDRFAALNQRITNLNATVNGEFGAYVTQINEIAKGIADLNGRIAAAGNQLDGQKPNDFLDRRDQLIRDLSKLVGVDVVEQSDGSLGVFIGNGQALVLGTTAAQLQVADGIRDPFNKEISIQIGNQRSEITSLITGGKLGGVIQFRQEGLGSVTNELGRIALAIAATFNEQHQLGMDLDDELGRLFFNDINETTLARSRAIPSANNALPSDRVIEVRIDDAGQLTTSDYTLTFNGVAGIDSFAVIRQSDGQQVATGSVAGGLPQTITVDGLEIELTSGSFQLGDSFRLQPTRFAARDIGLAVADPRDIALAQPIRGIANPANQGTGVLSQGEVIDTDPLTAPGFATPLTYTPPLLIRFTSATTYDIMDATDPVNPVTLVAGQPFLPGQENQVFSTDDTQPFPLYTGFTFSVRGNPVAGDEFLIRYNNGGVSDNRNALKLAGIQTTEILGNGSLTLNEAYGNLISRAASQAADARVGRDAAQALLTASEERRSAISRVNLDEEAANLIRFEQAYNANAQVVAVAQELIDTILAAVR